MIKDNVLKHGGRLILNWKEIKYSAKGNECASKPEMHI